MASENSPMVNQFWGGEEKFGKSKHGGPITAATQPGRSDGSTLDECGWGWCANGAPFVRSVFRAKDNAPEELDDEFLRRRGDTQKRITDYVEEYKQAMIETGREDEIAASPEALEAVDEAQRFDGLPEEAVAELRRAFASKDEEAMADVMKSLDKYDPKHKNFDERIDFWVKEFTRAWTPEFQKDGKVAKKFVVDTIMPYMPEEFKEIENDRLELEKYEESKAKALVSKNERRKEYQSGFPPAVDITDSAIAIVQAKSAAAEWETNGVMGMHPGVGFGCHCAASLEALPLEATDGIEFWQESAHHDPFSLDFALRYPKSKGRDVDKFLGDFPKVALAKDMPYIDLKTGQVKALEY